MIKDDETRAEIVENWNGVEIVRSKIEINLLGAVGFGDGIYPFYAADAAFNLPFIQAVAVLNDALQAYAFEGRFGNNHKIKRSFDQLLKLAKNELSWKNYSEIIKLKKLRDLVAHHGELVPRGECWGCVDTVKAELIHWGLVEVGSPEPESD